MSFPNWMPRPWLLLLLGGVIGFGLVRGCLYDDAKRQTPDVQTG